MRELDSGWTPAERFAVFVETMREHFAFFELWGVDWEQRVANHASQVDSNTTDAELFEIYAKMLAGIDDAHLGLSAVIDGETRSLEFGKGPTKNRLKALFQQQDAFADLNSYFNSWYQAYLQGIEHQILSGRGQTDAGGRLRWGWLEKQVGYLHLTGLGGYGADPLVEDLAILEDALDKAVETLSGARALILDLTYNQGGVDLFGQAVAGRFADQQRLAFSRRPLTKADAEYRSYVAPSPRVHYTGPVYVVTSDITMSSAETLVLYLRVLPHVTLCGQRTRGAFSDVLDKPLPHGTMLALSNEVYEAADGECYERRGIPPEIPLTVFEPDDPWTGHVSAIQRVRDLAVAAAVSGGDETATVTTCLGQSGCLP